MRELEEFLRSLEATRALRVGYVQALDDMIAHVRQQLEQSKQPEVGDGEEE